MLTSEQCIEVAEKVWGWVKHPQGWYYPGPEIKIDQLNYARDEKAYIESQVNSWQGFGRTVEAMAEEGFKFGYSNGVAYFFNEQIQVEIEGDMILATHLAALEAMKK